LTVKIPDDSYKTLYAIHASFGPTIFEKNEITDANLVAPNPYHGCSNIENEIDIKNNVVILIEGNCQIGTKVKYMENLGAIAVIIINSNKEDGVFSIQHSEDIVINIPTIMITNSEGYKILYQINQNIKVDLSPKNKEPNVQYALFTLLMDPNYKNSVSQFIVEDSSLSIYLNENNIIISYNDQGIFWQHASLTFDIDRNGPIDLKRLSRPIKKTLF